MTILISSLSAFSSRSNDIFEVKLATSLLIAATQISTNYKNFLVDTPWRDLIVRPAGNELY